MQTGMHRYPLLERVIYGKPAVAAIVKEAERAGATRVFLTTNRSLGGAGGLTAGIAAGLRDRCVGTYAGITAHSPRESVIAGAAQARAARADLLVAVGGGSVIDATKLMLACLWHGLTRTEELDALRGTRGADPSRRPKGMENAIRMFAVPTTFSAAEFTHVAGVTDTQRRAKEGFGHALFTPQAVVLDPAATLQTPLDLLLSTGMKAVDHAVEWLCALNTTPFSDAVSGQALTLLARALPAIKSAPQDLDARLEGQLGMWLSISGAATGVGVGVSHAIGHTLGGSYGVPHGITSCVTLPSALRWNAAANLNRQREASRLMGKPEAAAADLVADLVQRLGLPGRLRDVGIRREDFQAIADHTMHDAPVRTNPRKIERPADIVEILELAW